MEDGKKCRVCEEHKPLEAANKRKANAAKHRKALSKGYMEYFSTKACQQCASSEGKIHAHHRAGYDVLHQLVVQWLCTECYGEAHRKDDNE